jgi:HKD family nuclease
MGVDIYYFYHGFGLKAFEGRHIKIYILTLYYLNITGMRFVDDLFIE